MGYEETHCSKRYNKIVDATHEVFLSMEAGFLTLEEYQLALKIEAECLAELGPEDFGLQVGDIFVDVTRYNLRSMYRIAFDGRLLQHTENDGWLMQKEYSLRDAMGLTMKGKWLRMREIGLRGDK